MNEMDYKKYFGFYRARVVDPKPEKYSDYGAVKVSIPDFMSEELGKTESGADINLFKHGLIAYPANNPVGGRNPQKEDESDTSAYYQGCVYTPPKNSYVWICFEGGDIERPYFFAAFDGKSAKLPPEQTLVDNPHQVFTILKTHSGRTICVSDDKDTQRIEITGKKRTLEGDDPAGNDSSTYAIDGNMSTILFDERTGREKLLIRTRLGDYIHIDIDERKLQIEFDNDIIIKSNSNISIEATKKIMIKSGQQCYITSDQAMHIKAGEQGYFNSGGQLNLRSGGFVGIDGIFTYIQSGVSQGAASASPPTPEGSRDS